MIARGRCLHNGAALDSEWRGANCLLLLQNPKRPSPAGSLGRRRSGGRGPRAELLAGGERFARQPWRRLESLRWIWWICQVALCCGEASR